MTENNGQVADTPSADEVEGTTAHAQDEPKATFKSLGQHVKDLSFECLQWPFTVKGQEQDLDFNLGVRLNTTNDPSVYEVGLDMQLKARAKETAEDIYILEMLYVGVYRLENIPEERVAPLLSIDGAALIFPYAREVLQHAVLSGGFRPPMLEPINFHALYLQNTQQGRSAPEEQQAAKDETAS